MTATAKKTAPAKAGKTQTAKRNERKVNKARGAAAPTGKPRDVKEIASANRGHDTVAILHDGSTHTITDYHKIGIAVNVGDNFDSRKTAYLAETRKRAESKGPGHLAKGVDARNSPHSVKAHQDAKSKGGKAEAPAKAKKAERKAARVEKAAPKSDDTRKITIVDKKFTFGGDGTARRASWDAVKTGMTVADYVKAGGKAKYLPRWASAGAIKLS